MTARGETLITSLGTQVPPCPLQGCPRGASAPWAGGDIHQGETMGEVLPSTSQTEGSWHITGHRGTASWDCTNL